MDITFVGDDFDRALALLDAGDLKAEVSMDTYREFLAACFFEGREKDQEGVIREAMKTYNKPAPEAMLAWTTRVKRDSYMR